MASTAPPPRRPITLRARPFLFISIFAVVHQSIATASLPPVYYYFQSTGSSATLLAGPYAAFVLRQRVPFTDQKIEDYVDRSMRGILGRGVGYWSQYRARKQAKRNGAEEGAIASAVEVPEEQAPTLWAKYKARREDKKAVATIESKQVDGGDVAQEAVARMEGKKVNSFRDQVVERATGIKMRQVMDAAAAYLVVKVRVICHRYLDVVLNERSGARLCFPLD